MWIYFDGKSKEYVLSNCLFKLMFQALIGYIYLKDFANFWLFKTLQLNESGCKLQELSFVSSGYIRRVSNHTFPNINLFK